MAFKPSLLLLSVLLIQSSLPVAVGQGNQVSVAKFYPVAGFVGLHEGLQAATVQVHLTLGDGDKRTTVPRVDGSFKFLDVPPGTHLIEVVALGYFYPAIRVDVSARHDGRIHAAYAEDKKNVLGPEMLIQPVRKMEYFEKRPEFSVWGLVTNPMMMMMLFSLFCVVVLSNIDPETMKEMQEQMKELEKAQAGGGGGGEEASSGGTKKE
mmetsp:Transcript_30252/g.36737  ORF Transcript_30252/g.36737 Transcript_30252/m.36737 type:complete len:208 (-) Transcript_30252:142-765(-)|eukprot:CAMPEP_0197844048 /NCGR_PEP_ID=MMETSP1438-20131217/1017_1 /TAXON_ID=1461541 /ORGANISM="Pterosperma sp., Strain CCMP1384" /LENGTH=207 /DNA_ID=CAMNT_0043454595 /DNA_START=120 /DNA_END=743 /DNA_ORIENTATION=+